MISLWILDEKRFLLSLVSGCGVNPSFGARVLVLWVDLGTIGDGFVCFMVLSMA